MTRCRTALSCPPALRRLGTAASLALACAVLPVHAEEEEAPPPVRVIQAPMSAHHQGRDFPQDSLRGELEIVSAPQAKLGGKTVQLAPGLRLYDELNRLALTAQYAGRKVRINYRVDFLGQIAEAWVLSEPEQKRLWPTKPEEAAKWRFDPVWKVWTKS